MLLLRCTWAQLTLCRMSSVAPQAAMRSKTSVRVFSPNGFSMTSRRPATASRMRENPRSTLGCAVRVAVAPTPIVRGNEVYVTAGYGAGCMKVQVGPGNEVTTVFENKVMKNHHGGVILVGEHLYGHADQGSVCQAFKKGAEVWNHRGFGKGAVGYADGMLYCVDENNGNVALVEASPKGWNEHGKFRLEPQSKIRAPAGRVWTHPVILNGKLYLRDQDLIYCYDVKA